MTDLGSKKPLQLDHFGYEDAKILGTKVWGGLVHLNLTEGMDKWLSEYICQDKSVTNEYLNTFALEKIN